MKFRITPLNIITALFLMISVYSLIYGVKISGYKFRNMGGTISWIFLLFAVVVSLMDIMFRNFFAETKKIWIVELSFITLAAIIFLLVK